MVKLIRQGVYLMEGRLVKESQAFKIGRASCRERV